MVFKWKNGSIHGVNVQDVGDCIERIIEQQGGATAKRLVDEGRNPKSPLHPCFEWDDTKAAEKHREDQARFVLRHVVIVKEEPEMETLRVRAFVPVTQNDETHYTTIETAMGDADLRDQVITRARSEIVAWQNKYRDLREFARIFEIINEVVAV